MRALFAIAKQTVRASLRSRVFHVLLTMILLAVFALPLGVSGDGTAASQLQISLTYSLGIVTVLLSAATLWLGCGMLAREIESYNLHLVLTKPAPAWIVWLGKWTGIVVMQGFLLLMAAAIVYGLIMWRLRSRDFSEQDRLRARHTILVGRRVHWPEQKHDFQKLAQQDYRRRLQQGSLSAEHDPAIVQGEILRQLQARSAEVPPGAARYWAFRGIRVADPEERIFLRYRFYLGNTSDSSQRQVQGIWGFRDVRSKDEDRFLPLPQQVMSGTYQQLTLPARIVDDDGSLIVGYTNRSADSQSVLFQQADGPVLMTRAVGFSNNYVRSIVLALLQIAFLAALGCTAGAAFHTPVAVFVGVSYLVIGMTVQAAVRVPTTDQLGRFKYKTVTDRILHTMARTVDLVVVAPDDFDATSDLTQGQLVELSRLATVAGGLVLLRGGALALLGMWVLNRRELGTVVRK